MERRRVGYGSRFIELHLLVLEAVRLQVKENGFPYVLVSGLGKKCRTDIRTVKFHLRVMEFDGLGTLSKNDKVFVVKQGEPHG